MRFLEDLACVVADVVVFVLMLALGALAFGAVYVVVHALVEMRQG